MLKKPITPGQVETSPGVDEGGPFWVLVPFPPYRGGCFWACGGFAAEGAGEMLNKPTAPGQVATS
jgi:hypothetical protein